MKSRHCAATNAPRKTLAAAGLALAVGTLLFVGTLPAQAQTSGNTGPAKTVTPAKTKSGAKAPAATDAKSRASYSLGVNFGSQLRGVGMTSDTLAYDRVVQGLKDALAGKATMAAEDEQRIQALITEVRATQGQANKAAADKFLAQNGKLPGIVTTASGLQYKVVRPGAGESPKATDEVTVNYRGTLLDGSEFDSSYKTGQPVSLTVGKVIKGWVEALQLMKPGAKFELYIPPDLAYGMDSRPPIPPGSLLKFEVELISAKPATAASAMPAPVPGGAAPKH